MQPTVRSPRRLLSLAAVLVLATAPLAAQDAADLPAAGDVLSRYIEALGGEDAIRALDNLTWKAKLEMPGMGIEAEMTMKLQAPNRFHVEMSSPAMGSMAQGYDGEVAWMDSQMTGPMLLEGDQLEALKLQGDFYADLNYAVHYPVLETVAVEEFDGQKCYRLHGETPSGRESELYFSVDTGLLAGIEGDQATPMGDVFVTIKLGGYEEFGGRLFATEQRQEVMGAEQIMTLIEADFSAIDPSAFELPPAIRTLVEAGEPG
ncbi:MAG: hypothetical protein R3190_09390 [Thermoanaerobaculia bacterium]|nr:hypothetical protein [Thermoanaerobaculia bacterium]